MEVVQEDVRWDGGGQATAKTVGREYTALCPKCGHGALRGFAARKDKKQKQILRFAKDDKLLWEG